MSGPLPSSVPAGAATLATMAARGPHALASSDVGGEPGRQHTPASAVQSAGGRAGLGAALPSHNPASASSESAPGGARQGGDGEQQQVIAGAELEQLRTVHFMMYQHVQLLQQHIKELHASFEPEVRHF